MALNLAHLEPISLEEMDEVASLRTRIDRKYIVDRDTVTAIVESLPPSSAVLDLMGKGVLVINLFILIAQTLTHTVPPLIEEGEGLKSEVGFTLIQIFANLR